MSQLSDKELEGKEGFKETKRIMEEDYGSPGDPKYVVPIVVFGLVFPLIAPKSLQVEPLAVSLEDKLGLKIKGIMECDSWCDYKTKKYFRVSSSKIIRLPISKKVMELIEKYKEKMIGYVKFYLEMGDEGEFYIIDLSVNPFDLAQTFC